MMKRILIVEDDLLLSLVVSRFLKSRGYETVTETNCQGALEKIKSQHFDLVIMDIRIKGCLDGVEVMVEAKRYSDVRVIYLTGNSELSTRERAAQTNIVCFLVKPVVLEELDVLIKEEFRKEVAEPQQ